MRNLIIIILLLIVGGIYYFRGTINYESHDVVLDDIKNIGKLYLLKQSFAEIRDGSYDSAKATYTIKGYAYYYLDFEKIEIKKIAKKENTQENNSEKVDIILSGINFEYKTDQSKVKLFTADDDFFSFSQEKYKEIEKDVRKMSDEYFANKAKEDKYISRAKKYAEEFINDYFSILDIEINSITWKDSIVEG